MKLEIKTERMQFMVAKPAEPKSDGRGGQKNDRETRELLWVVELVAMDETGAEVIKVTIAGQQPPRVAPGQHVQVTGLVAFPWAIEDKHGVAYRAAGITPLKQPAAA
jgi:hypothetical protein